MGKKNGRKREREEEENDDHNPEIDEELEAELAALQEIQNERNAHESEEEEDGNDKHENKRGTYNREGLLHCIESLHVNNLPFIESMAICEYELQIQDENDDLEREMAFYNHAIQGVAIGKSRFAELKIPFKRPDDYFCESLKSDAHMARIKDRLIIEEKRIDAFEKRKQRELNRKYNKQVAAIKKSEKSQHVKSEINSSKNEFKDKDDGSKGGRPQKSFKRQAMDKKYGFGGKEKKKAKMNDQKSLNDFSQYHPRGGKLVRREKKNGRGGGSGGGKKNGKGANRPGKKARTERRAARSSSG